MAKKELKKIDLISLGKILGGVSAVFGFVVGALVTIAAIIGRGFLRTIANLPEMQGMIPTTLVGQSSMALGIGLFSIIFFPIIYGISGFVSGIVTGFLYNFIAENLGGVEVDLE